MECVELHSQSQFYGNIFEADSM